MQWRASSELSKKSKIIEIGPRSSENGGPKRYHSQGGSPQIVRVAFGKFASNLRRQLMYDHLKLSKKSVNGREPDFFAAAFTCGLCF